MPDEKYTIIAVKEVMTTRFPTVSPEMSFEELTKLFASSKDHGFPVVDSRDPSCLLGVLRRRDMVKAYVKALSQQKQT